MNELSDKFSSPDNPSRQKKDLTIKRRDNSPAPTGPTKKCPACGKLIDEDATICVGCGFDLAAGKKLKTKTKGGGGGGAAKKLAQLVILLAVLVGAYYGYTTYLAGNEEAKDKMLSTLTEVKDKASTALEDSGMQDLVEEAKAAADQTTREFKRDILNQDVEDATAEAESKSEPEPAPPAEETPQAESISTTEDTLTATMTQQFNDKYPLLNQGDEAVVRTIKGETVKGSIAGLTQTAILLQTESGAQKLPYNELHNTSRVRCDVQFREATLKKAIAKKRASAGQ